jgi:hypothetical protein
MLSDGIMVDHGVHIAAADQKTQTGSSKHINRLGVFPVGLGDDTHGIAGVLQNTADDGMTEGRVIHIGIADYIYKVAAFPATVNHILFANGQKRHILPPIINIFSIITDVAMKGK